jgi:spoIIIJ-associated protein
MGSETDTEIWVEDFLTELLEKLGLDLAIEELYTDDDKALIIQLGGPDSAVAIGRDGLVLDALQHVTIAASIHRNSGRQRILVDVEHYRERREQRLREKTVRFAEEAMDTGEIREFRPMSARERRLVHMVVADIDGVTTESLGEDDGRFVRVIPI